MRRWLSVEVVREETSEEGKTSNMAELNLRQSYY